ncbi:hypothetical protein GIX45_24045 [Erwinia sp. CPCC 100877]|nr:hypothetical protein [Erwinia sp. CPCC 100877]
MGVSSKANAEATPFITPSYKEVTLAHGESHISELNIVPIKGYEVSLYYDVSTADIEKNESELFGVDYGENLPDIPQLYDINYTYKYVVAQYFSEGKTGKYYFRLTNYSPGEVTYLISLDLDLERIN